MSLTRMIRKLRRRPARAGDDPDAVFRAFVQVLTQLRAQTRHAPFPEKN